jgi:acetylornithine aminotransferase
MTTLETIEIEKLRENALAMGDAICNGLRAALNGLAGVVVIRNAGLMIGVELDRPCAELVKMALEDKLLINVTAEKVVRLLPPLIINQTEADELVSRLATMIKTFLNKSDKV